MNAMKTAFLGSVAALLLTPVSVLAQTTGNAAQSDDPSGEIIVTARRQDELLRDVPASITAISERTIANTGARVAADFVQLTPGVTIVTGVVEAGDTQIAIRGINGARDGENNVALVVDGVLKTNTALLAQDQGAVTQIEILKGPQGAYYGRSAVAGAIVLTTKKPGDRLEVSGRLSAANNRTYNVAALVSGPFTDTLGFVINGDYASTSGFYRDIFQSSGQNLQVYPNNQNRDRSVDDNRRFNINGRLLFTPSADTELDFKVRYAELKGASIAFNAVFQIPLLADIISPDFNIDANDHEFVFARNIDPENNQSSFEASLHLTQKLSEAIDMTAYVAYSQTNNDFFADGTSGTFNFFDNQQTCIASQAALAGFPVQAPFGVSGTPGVGFLPPYSPTSCDGTQYQQRDQKDFTAEIRLSGETGGGIDWSFGGYYLYIDRFNCNNLGLDTGNGVIRECFTTDPKNRTEALAQDTFTTNVYAAFGSLQYKPTDRLTLSAALRYDIEARSTENSIPTGRQTRWVGNVLTGNPNGTATTPANYYLNPGLDPVYNPSGVLAPRDATFKQLQPKISISYAASDNINLYANWGIGFKSGGFNNAGSQAIVNGFFNQPPVNAGLSISDQFDKETTSAFEVGVKGNIAPGINFELAGYYTDVNDSQFFEFFVGPFGLLRVVSNVDKIRLKGLEASFNAQLTRGLSIFGSANYIDSEIIRNTSRPDTVGNKAPATSDYTVNLGAQYDGPIADTLGILLRADYRITGPTWFHTVQNNDVPNIFGLTGNFNNSQRDAFGVLNLRAGLRGDNWSLVAFGQNVLKERFLAEVIAAPEFGGAFVAPGALQTYGVEATFKF